MSELWAGDEDVLDAPETGEERANMGGKAFAGKSSSNHNLVDQVYLAGIFSNTDDEMLDVVERVHKNKLVSLGDLRGRSVEEIFAGVAVTPSAKKRFLDALRPFKTDLDLEF